MGGLLTPARRDDKFLNKFLNNSVPGQEPWSSLGAGEALQPSPGLGDDEHHAWQVLSKQESPADGDPSWTQECIKWEEPLPGQGQWPGSFGTSREGQTPSPARLHISLPGCA